MLKWYLITIVIFILFGYLLISPPKNTDNEIAKSKMVQNAEKVSKNDLELNLTKQPEKTVTFNADKPFEDPKDVELSLLFKDYRKNYQNLTGFEFSGLHWEQIVNVFLNQAVDVYEHNYECHKALLKEEDAEVEFRRYPKGTIFIKENYFKDENRKPKLPSSITAMIKHEPGFDPKYGDWEYIQYSPNGDMIFRGKSDNPTVKAMCFDCHANMAERDFIYTTVLKKNKQ